MGQNGDHASEGLPARPREELHNLAKNIADCTGEKNGHQSEILIKSHVSLGEVLVCLF